MKENGVVKTETAGEDELLRLIQNYALYLLVLGLMMLLLVMSVKS